MCDLLMLLVMGYNRTEKLDFCKKPKVGCDVTDVTCDKVTEKSGFWRRRLLICTIRPGTYSCLRFDRPFPIGYGPNLLFIF